MCRAVTSRAALELCPEAVVPALPNIREIGRDTVTAPRARHAFAHARSAAADVRTAAARGSPLAAPNGGLVRVRYAGVATAAAIDTSARVAHGHAGPVRAGFGTGARAAGRLVEAPLLILRARRQRRTVRAGRRILAVAIGCASRRRRSRRRSRLRSPDRMGEHRARREAAHAEWRGTEKKRMSRVRRGKI